MPTARELLEQADALMRRNRARDQAPPAPADPAPAVADEVPELTEVAAVAAGAPEAMEPPAVPASGEAEPEAAAPAAPGPAPPDAASTEVSGPVVREALARELATPAGVRPLPTSVGPQALDDIPELTEVVEEIEAPSILDATGDFEMGEPSVWMEPGHGEVSIVGKWPEVPDGAAGIRDAPGAADAVTVDETEVGVLHVAPELVDAALAAALPSDDVLARGALDAAPSGSEVAAAPAGAVPAIEFGIEDVLTPAQDEAEAEAVGDEAEAEAVGDDAEAQVAGESEAPVDRASEAMDPESAAQLQPEAGEAPSAAEPEPPTSAPAEAEVAVAAVAESVEPFEEPAEMAGPASTPVGPVSEEPSVATVAAAPAAVSAALSAATETSTPDAAALAVESDAERWDRLAEEVRMQVLQRIDIFTDTGLQEQLARRLQPMVDRASADLVATINHHVGALMRAYVAEAIEREIEKWRSGGR